MLCPYVGLFISIVALACTFRRPTWARTLAIIGLIISGLITATSLFMVAR
ncbi:MAG: hypothetical protein FWD53_03465 [Phycisphaerales bacterium]|nr:hypothetical protein [Phycisphaerales bacterium]